jgi:hypothetical protein
LEPGKQECVLPCTCQDQHRSLLSTYCGHSLLASRNKNINKIVALSGSGEAGGEFMDFQV